MAYCVKYIYAAIWALAARKGYERMTNIALIVAGGSGVRAGKAVPKQFLTVYDNPIIAYTMENIEKFSPIDEIYVVGPAGWESFITAYAKQLEITKFRGVIFGGKTRQESIYNGIRALVESHENAFVMITDANRPLIPHSVFQSCIAAKAKSDCSVAVTPCYDSMYVSKDGEDLVESADRGNLYNGQCPECAELKTLAEVYNAAEKDGISDLPAAALFLKYKKRVAAVNGSAMSFKITTAEDIELFKAMLALKEKGDK